MRSESPGGTTWTGFQSVLTELIHYNNKYIYNDSPVVLTHISHYQTIRNGGRISTSLITFVV